MKKVKLIETKNLKYFEEGFLGAEGELECIDNIFHFYFSVQSMKGFCMSSKYKNIRECGEIVYIQVMCGGEFVFKLI